MEVLCGNKRCVRGVALLDVAIYSRILAYVLIKSNPVEVNVVALL